MMGNDRMRSLCGSGVGVGVSDAAMGGQWAQHSDPRTRIRRLTSIGHTRTGDGSSRSHKKAWHSVPHSPAQPHTVHTILHSPCTALHRKPSAPDTCCCRSQMARCCSSSTSCRATS